MITCPSCNHQNPEGSLQCENCYTPLPASTSCPNCGTSVQTDATFCGQCGFNLQAENPLTMTAEGGERLTSMEEIVAETAIGSLPDMSLEDMSLEELSPTGAMPDMPLAEVEAEAESDMLPETSMSSPISSPWDEDEDEDLTLGQPRFMSNLEPTETMNFASLPDLDSARANSMPWEAESPDLDLGIVPPKTEAATNEPKAKGEINTSNLRPMPQPDPPGFANISGATQLQVETASLLHLQSDTKIAIASNLDVVHIGKPNGQIPPDIDVAGFPDSEVVSRLHADIRIEGDAYYIEDVGSSNGTYVNHAPLLRGNRHRLRPGDRIALGKGDLVTFIFQLG
jgi:FHA domain/Double zinc ribbon